MRSLKVFTSLWAMQPHDRSGTILPEKEICELVASAGYDGLAIDLGVADVEQAQRIRPHIEKCGLTPLIVAFPKTVSGLRDTLLMAKDFNSPFVDVIGQVTPVTVDGMIPVVRSWIEMAEAIDIPVQFETHRNCLTNDLYSTLSLLDAVPEMRLSADLSHYVVDREFRLPLNETDSGHIERILHRSDSFQGRVAGRQQIQLQIEFPQHQRWVELFKGFWRTGLSSWRSRNMSGDCVFLCELGPPEYAITDGSGKELSDRWNEALTIKSWIEEIWDDLETSSR